MAKELAAMLESELAKPIMTGDERSRQQMIALRVYLAHALSRFQVPEALPALVAAAQPTQNSELEVRLAALAALARWRSEYPAGEQVDDKAPVELLFEASRDSEPRVRERAAFALGVFDPQQTREQLVRLLEDPYPDVRYNAATALARHGNAESIPVILEMLDPDQGAALEAEATESDREQKQALIWLSALEAVKNLTSVDQAQLAQLREGVTTLAEADIPDPIRVRAEGTLQTLAGQSPE
jgi:HEAT repeat protein